MGGAASGGAGSLVRRSKFEVEIPKSSPPRHRGRREKTGFIKKVSELGALSVSVVKSNPERLTAEAQRARRRMVMNGLTEKIIGAAIEVHKALGPGLLESAYEGCLAHEFSLANVPFERQVPLPITYKSVQVDCGYRLDFLIENTVVLELKAVEALQPIHEAQLLTYLKLGGWPIGLLINFNVSVLKKGIKRMVHNLT